MDLNLEAKKELVGELALQLHMEFWMMDHRAIIDSVAHNILNPKKRVKGSASEVAEQMKEQLDSWHKKCARERTTDTTAVAIASNGDIVIAANIKKRTEQGIRRGGKGGGTSSAPNPAEFGFYDRRHELTIQRVSQTFPQTRQANIINLVPAAHPRTPQENAELHAEMQIMRYAKQERLHIEVMGISKPACEKCAEVLDLYPLQRVETIWDEDGSPVIPPPGSTQNQGGAGKKITNWERPSEYGFGRIMRRARIQHRFQVLTPGEEGEQVVEWQVGKETPFFYVRPIHSERATYNLSK
ncbi:hypothetical protein MFIFM68171_09559 [Madurella fahalii]|uniref:Uncharacterized protein n=1 Tax=Madurella fahalii TaxID=1157608 RepID=A0ABQ0GNQ6_9PEZI